MRLKVIVIVLLTKLIILAEGYKPGYDGLAEWNSIVKDSRFSRDPNQPDPFKKFFPNPLDNNEKPQKNKVVKLLHKVLGNDENIDKQEEQEDCCQVCVCEDSPPPPCPTPLDTKLCTFYPDQRHPDQCQCAVKSFTDILAKSLVTFLDVSSSKITKKNICNAFRNLACGTVKVFNTFKKGIEQRKKCVPLKPSKKPCVPRKPCVPCVPCVPCAPCAPSVPCAPCAPCAPCVSGVPCVPCVPRGSYPPKQASCSIKTLPPRDPPCRPTPATKIIEAMQICGGSSDPPIPKKRSVFPMKLRKPSFRKRPTVSAVLIHPPDKNGVVLNVGSNITHALFPFVGKWKSGNSFKDKCENYVKSKINHLNSVTFKGCLPTITKATLSTSDGRIMPKTSIRTPPPPPRIFPTRTPNLTYHNAFTLKKPTETRNCLLKNVGKKKDSKGVFRERNVIDPLWYQESYLLDQTGRLRGCDRRGRYNI